MYINKGSIINYTAKSPASGFKKGLVKSDGAWKNNIEFQFVLWAVISQVVLAQDTSRPLSFNFHETDDILGSLPIGQIMSKFKVVSCSIEKPACPRQPVFFWRPRLTWKRMRNLICFYVKAITLSLLSTSFRSQHIKSWMVFK